MWIPSLEQAGSVGGSGRNERAEHSGTSLLRGTSAQSDSVFQPHVVSGVCWALPPGRNDRAGVMTMRSHHGRCITGTALSGREANEGSRHGTGDNLMQAAEQDLLRLFPEPAARRPLRGLYLDEALRPSGTRTRPFVYASFVASLDGRISQPDPETRTRKPPAAITNPRDWRLFQELAASADVLVTSGRYIRDLAAGGAQAGLPVSRASEFEDLLAWRKERRLAPQPAVVIVSGSLDLPIPATLLDCGRAVYVATGRAAEPARIDALIQRGVRVLEAGRGARVQGRALIKALAHEGFGNIDMVAGSGILNTLIADHAFDRLYLTQASRILGGVLFDTLIKGGPLDPPADFELHALHYDAPTDAAAGQLFAAFDYRRSGASRRARESSTTS